MPDEDTAFEKGDELIVLTHADRLKELEERFNSGQAGGNTGKGSA